MRVGTRNIIESDDEGVHTHILYAMEVQLLKVKKKYIVVLCIASILLIMIGVGLDNRIQMTNYNINDTRIPDAFEGFKIAQLSDIHCVWFGQGQSKLITAVEAGAPDIIVLTGDIIDQNIQDYDSVDALFAGLTKIAPVYAVSGNHENKTALIRTKMDVLYKEHGVHILKDASTMIEKDGSDIFIYGLDDRRLISKNIPTVDADKFGILLFHRSNLFDNFTNLGYGLVFSGHLHGGLIRLPFVGGILSPEGGKLDFSQKYTGGLYTAGKTTLVSNRGMAGSHNIPRIFNRPEIVFVTLHHAV